MINLFSKQYAKVQENGLRYFQYFYLVSPGQHSIITAPVLDGSGFDSLEELLNRVKIPLTVDPEQLKKFIAKDFEAGFGTHYPEYKVVAWVGPHESQRPIFCYDYGDKEKWIFHPQANLMLHRYT